MQSQSARVPLTDWIGCAFLEALSSPPVTFLVGQALEPVVAPVAFMLDLSPRFAFRIEGSMAEARENRLALPAIEKEFFLRLVEFAYHGDYTVSRFLDDPQVWGDVEPVQDPEREDESDDSDYEVDEGDAAMEEGDTASELAADAEIPMDQLLRARKDYRPGTGY
ncbi:hypothetical protein ACET3X_004738 [Alternaria dauci]|uniref:BTB domain-containing protein n=1 Tax=Alternaria dauci TaxID=48095 RepID=A0ABR3UJH9_9PLEO